MVPSHVSRPYLLRLVMHSAAGVIKRRSNQLTRKNLTVGKHEKAMLNSDCVREMKAPGEWKYLRKCCQRKWEVILALLFYLPLKLGRRVRKVLESRN